LLSDFELFAYDLEGYLGLRLIFNHLAFLYNHTEANDLDPPNFFNGLCSYLDRVFGRICKISIRSAYDLYQLKHQFNNHQQQDWNLLIKTYVVFVLVFQDRMEFSGFEIIFFIDKNLNAG